MTPAVVQLNPNFNTGSRITAHTSKTIKLHYNYPVYYEDDLLEEVI